MPATFRFPSTFRAADPRDTAASSASPRLPTGPSSDVPSGSLLQRLQDSFGIPVAELVAGHRQLEQVERPRHTRLWNYYRNPMLPHSRRGQGSSDRPYRQAQEWGMPARLTGYVTGDIGPSAAAATGPARKDIVIENDIGWRIDAMIDHLFGRELTLDSAADDPARGRLLGGVVRRVFDLHGGLRFFQQMALFGMVYGFVDVVVRYTPPPPSMADAPADAAETTSLSTPTPAPEHDTAQTHGTGTPTDPGEPVGPDDLDGRGRGDHPDGRLIERLARQFRLEIVHPSHALPVPREDAPAAYAVLPRRDRPAADASASWWSRFFSPLRTAPAGELPGDFELWTAEHRLVVAGGRIAVAERHALGRVPVVHIQNLAAAFEYAGRSDVEPLIPLQDELNTRLSDRAHRITMQSFRMFLAKGIDNFLSVPVSPGRMWATDNESAEIIEFGGDANCPSEQQHIADIREAMDKASGVPPVAAGLIRDRVGQLSSAAALRVTLQALLAKTDRKRATYGRGIAELGELILLHLHASGQLPSRPEERVLRLSWPSPLPESGAERLHEAELKLKLGIPPETVRRELGY
ncbi:MAG: phage portal protein [Tepidisphaerales bacterium]